MMHDQNPILAFVWSGWTATWPTALLALIWAAWLISWAVGSLFSGRTEKHVRTWDSRAYRVPILVGAVLLTPWTEHILGEKPLWHVGSSGTYLLALLTLAGTLVHVVGANSSWTLLVERHHTQGRPSGHRHRPLRTGSPSDLYRAYRGHAGDGHCGCDRDSTARHGADCFRSLAEGAHGRRLSDDGARRGGLRTLLPPRANAGSVFANTLV